MTAADVVTRVHIGCVH